MTKQYHIAVRGKNAGKLVPCYAKNCTLGNTVIPPSFPEFNLDEAAKPTHKIDFYSLAENYAQGNAAQRTAVALDHRSSARLLAYIAETEQNDDYILYLVARHPNTPETTLRKLAHNSYDVYVHQGIAENFNCPKDLLAYFEDYDRDSIVREKARRTAYIQDNPKTPLAISLNPNSTAEQLDAIKDTPDGLDDSVRNYVAQHPNTSPETLRYLSKKIMGTWGASSNPNTPKDVLFELAKHPQDNVRTNVYYNPALTAEERKSINFKHDPEVIGYISPSYYKGLEARRKLMKTEY